MKKWRCKICGYIHHGENPPRLCPVCGAGPEDFKVMEELFLKQDSPGLQKIIIIGNGAAGMEAARAAREKNSAVEITVFAEEPHPFYSRIHLSTFIGEEPTGKDITIYPENWYREQKIEVKLDTPIVQLLPAKKKIIDREGKSYFYDKLILACGARPAIPDLPGMELPGIFSLRTLSDAMTIREYARHCREAVVLGGGILGIEAAASLNRQGMKVTLIEMADHLLSRQLDNKGAEVLQNTLQGREIICQCNTRIQKFLGTKQLERVMTDREETLSAQMALISAGIVPRTGLAREAGINVNRGIIVDEHMATSVQDIFAAGDVAEFQGQIAGIWPAAVDQGISAASNALGIPHLYTGTLPLHILKVAGVEMTALGQKYPVSASEEEFIHVNPAAGEYIKLVHNHDHLLGAVVLGVTGIGFRLEKLIRQGQSVGPLLPEFKKGNWEILRTLKQL